MSGARSDPFAAADTLHNLATIVEATAIADLPALLGELEHAKALVWSRLMTPAPRASETHLVGASEMADQLGVTESWVRTAARRHRIPTVPAGAHLRFDPVEVLTAMKGGSAAGNREKLSERGRRAAEHRIHRPGRKKESNKDRALVVPATTPLPSPIQEDGRLAP